MAKPKKKQEERTVTNIAWTELFNKHSILDEIKERGFYQIKSDTIKEVHEPRLMAKFDHKSNLPYIFTENNLSILPISRGEYILGEFETFQKVKYDKKIKPQTVEFPSYITTIDPNNLYSESLALNIANISGMINDVLGEEAEQTISGRMSSKQFDFNISTRSGIDKRINIKNSQIEIDGGYESDSYFMIAEAKNETVDDFLIRQLYYPYRLWEKQTPKKVKPVFFTYSNDIFSFFVYEFTDIGKYNSLKLIKQRDYTFTQQEIELKDILEMRERTEVINEPQVPFPQANNIKRLVDLLEKLMLGDIEKDMITLTYDFNVRQTLYYTDAGRYLGLIERYKIKKQNKNKTMFRLTPEGRRILQLSYKEKRLSIVSKILEHKPFRMVFDLYLQKVSRPGKLEVAEILKDCKIYNVNSQDTYERRSSTVLKWIDWILELQHEFE